MDAGGYGEAITKVHEAFKDDPGKAGALAEVLNLLVDRIRAAERENADLRGIVGKIGGDLGRLAASTRGPGHLRG